LYAVCAADLKINNITSNDGVSVSDDQQVNRRNVPKCCGYNCVFLTLLHFVSIATVAVQRSSTYTWYELIMFVRPSVGHVESVADPGYFHNGGV
jgi:hypothetical protein